MLTGVTPPEAEFTQACIVIVAVLSAAIAFVMREPVPLSEPVAASLMLDVFNNAVAKHDLCEHFRNC